MTKNLNLRKPRIRRSGQQKGAPDVPPEKGTRPDLRTYEDIFRYALSRKAGAAKRRDLAGALKRMKLTTVLDKTSI